MALTFYCSFIRQKILVISFNSTVFVCDLQMKYSRTEGDQVNQFQLMTSTRSLFCSICFIIKVPCHLTEKVFPSRLQLHKHFCVQCIYVLTLLRLAVCSVHMRCRVPELRQYLVWVFRCVTHALAFWGCPSSAANLVTIWPTFNRLGLNIILLEDHRLIIFSFCPLNCCVHVKIYAETGDCSKIDRLLAVSATVFLDTYVIWTIHIFINI